MDTIRDPYKPEIFLRPTQGEVALNIVLAFLPIGISLLIFNNITEDKTKSIRTLLEITDIIFFILSFFCANSAVRSLLGGKVQINSSDIMIKINGRSKLIPYASISNIVLTKTLLGKSLKQIVVISTHDFKKVYIYDSYEETAEDIFEFLKAETEKKGLGIKFYERPAFSII